MKRFVRALGAWAWYRGYCKANCRGSAQVVGRNYRFIVKHQRRAATTISDAMRRILRWMTSDHADTLFILLRAQNADILSGGDAMSESEKTPGWVTGQIAALGVAIGVLLADHPNRNVLLASISEQLEHLAESTKSRGIRAGIASARRMYIPPPLISGGA